MHIISNIALISINETLLVQMISFLIFLFIINRVMFRPLQTVMRQRDRHIEKINTDIVDAIKEHENITNQLNEREAMAKDEAFKIKEGQEEIANKEAAEIFTLARQEISVIKKKVEEETSLQITEARKTIEKESEALVLCIMEKVLDRRLVK